MSWLYLILAGIFEIGWPVGLKIAQEPQTRGTGFLIAGFFICVSGFFLWIAQKTIPVGTAYAIWTGIGAIGAFFVGIQFYGDASSLVRYVGIGLLVSGIVVLKLTS